MNLKFRNQNGITLIALVITIVVLLILAGVSIATLTGENGILTQATKAKELTAEAQELEKIELAVTSAGISNNKVLNEENLKNELDNYLGENQYNLYKEQSDYQLEIKDSERYYTIFSTLKVERREWIKYVENDVLKVKRGNLVIELGDYIGYNQLDFKDKENYATEYTSLENKNGIKDQDFIIDENVTWQVFDVDEKGKLKIISSVIKTESGEHFYLKGKNAYVNAIDELNKISELYGQGYGASYARSINYKDIEKLDGYDASLDTSKVGTNAEDGINFTFFWENNVTRYKTNTGLMGLNLSAETFYYYDEKNKEWKESTKQKDYTEIVTIKNINKRHRVDAKQNSYMTPYIYWNNKAYQMIKVNWGDDYFLADVGAFFNNGTIIMCYGVGLVSEHPYCSSSR